MKASVVTFPGSNCDEDAVHVLRDVMGVPVSRAWHKDTALPPATDLVVLPGGFSYGDALRSGAIARFSPIMAAVAAHAARGAPVLGICNGFQILLEAGLLPGAMMQNASTKFVCRVVELEVRTSKSWFTCDLEPGARLRLPVAHHEGRYHVDEDTLARMWDREQVALTYAVGDSPNGALARIAGVLSAAKNVLGLMPHPERAAEQTLGLTDGRHLLTSVLGSIERGSWQR